MSNITILQAIIELCENMGNDVNDKYVKSAYNANLIKYRMELENELKKNALAVVEHKLAHLVSKLK